MGAVNGANTSTDQPTRLRRAKFSTRSAAAAMLSAGLLIRVAISRRELAARTLAEFDLTGEID
jgi:hypothetical protein